MLGTRLLEDGPDQPPFRLEPMGHQGRGRNAEFSGEILQARLRAAVARRCFRPHTHVAPLEGPVRPPPTRSGVPLDSIIRGGVSADHSTREFRRRKFLDEPIPLFLFAFLHSRTLSMKGDVRVAQMPLCNGSNVRVDRIITWTELYMPVRPPRTDGAAQTLPPEPEGTCR
jgi:hypothetical protein